MSQLTEDIDNVGGVLRLWVVLNDKVQTFSLQPNGLLQVTLIDGATWEELPIIDDEAIYDRALQNTFQGDGFSHRVQCIVGKVQASSDDYFRKFLNQKVLVGLQDGNEAFFVVGSSNFPLVLKPNASTGRGPVGFNRYALLMEGNCPDTAFPTAGITFGA